MHFAHTISSEWEGQWIRKRMLSAIVFDLKNTCQFNLYRHELLTQNTYKRPVK